MPHDVNGKIVKPGDKVVIRGTVRSVSPGEKYCNCQVDFDVPMPTDEGGWKESISSINTKMIEVVE